jgi:hypothetical protein
LQVIQASGELKGSDNWVAAMMPGAVEVKKSSAAPEMLGV